MSVIKFLRDISDLFNWSTDENPTSQQDYQNAVKNWVTTETSIVDTVLWQPDTDYEVGNIVKTPSLPSQYVLECTTAGISGSTEPVYTTVSAGDNVTDGTVTWKVGNVITSNGGTMTGDITLVDGGKPVSTAVAGSTVSGDASNVSLTANTGKNIKSLSLAAGTWLVIGHVQFSSSSAGKFYGCELTTTSASYNYADNGSVGRQSHGGVVSVQCIRFFELSSTTNVYLVGWANEAVTVTKGVIGAIRIK